MWCTDFTYLRRPKGGCPYDNAPMERFYNTFKNCFYYRFIFESTEVLDERKK